MSEKRILLASLLKPVTDTRMYEKLACSISTLPGAQVHVVGFRAPLPPDAPAQIQFHPLFDFERLSMQRLSAPALYRAKLKELQPDLIICCTHELLLASVQHCRRHKVPLLYDVQENYSLNLLTQKNYLAPLRQVLAYLVRRTERLAAPHIRHFLLAETSYANELPFLQQGSYTIIENKYKQGITYTLPGTPAQVPHRPLRLLYSGTIADIYGIFEAIRFTEALHLQEPGTTLTIIGYSARQGTLLQVRQAIQNKPYIHLIGGDQLVPHHQIVEEISRHDLGLLPYQPHPSTFRCIPTKLYEYMAHGLPVLVQENPLWETIVRQETAGISLDFRKLRLSELLPRIRQEIYYTQGIPQQVYWQSEEIKLLHIINQCLTQHY